MQFEGAVTIRAPREDVYAFLMSPERVGRCAPGFESVTASDPEHFRVVAKVGVGYITARFTIDLTVTEAIAPEKAVLRGHGQAPGSAVDGTAQMTLSEDEDGTRMDWVADVDVHGTIATVGARLMQGTADKMIARTFDCIRTTLES